MSTTPQPAGAGGVDQAAEVDPTFAQQIKGFSRVFWIANFMEMLERLAYYGVRTVLPTYMVLSLAEGGPEFSHVDKGIIYGFWAPVQSFLPMFTGGYADRYGYKLTIAIAIVLKIVGYLMMAQFLSFWGFFTGCMFLAAGTAIFKPGVQGTLAQELSEKNGSVGWGIFYQLVNVGGFLGPILAGVLRLLDWQYVFYSCAVIVALNFLCLLTFEEPTKNIKDLQSDTRGPVAILVDSVVGMFKPRLLSFILLFSGFWLMFMQLFDILPNFLDDWVDSSSLWAHYAGTGLPGGEEALSMAAAGTPFNQEWIINLNPGLIVFCMVPIAWATGKLTPIRSILLGMSIATVGIYMLGTTMSIWMAIAGILVFSVGEMASSPKKMEYLSSLAKPSEKALYMGYANVPVGIGWMFGSFIGGYFYENYGDRTNLTRQHLHAQLGHTEHLVDALPKDDVFPALLANTGMEHAQAIQFLWDTYQPGRMWTMFAGIGILSIIGLGFYDYFIRKFDAEADKEKKAAGGPS